MASKATKPSIQMALFTTKQIYDNQIILNLTSWADSNRRKRFCRPVPKPLGHMTISLTFTPHKYFVIFK